MREVLKIINNELETLKIPYTFDGWDKDIELPQFIGELSETPSLDEDGLCEYSFILTGFATKNDIDYLLAVAEKLRERYKPSRIVDGIVIIYSNTMSVDTNSEDLKEIQTTLNIKKWSV